MTTIAYDGSTLAADRGMWSAGLVYQTTKLFRLDLDLGGPHKAECIVAMMGVATYCHALIAHMQDPKSNPMPDPHDYEMDGCHDVAFVWPKGQKPFTLSSLGVRMRVDTPYYACGAGREFAMGALLAGASPKRAVSLAIDYTDYAAHGVDVMSHA